MAMIDNIAPSGYARHAPRFRGVNFALFCFALLCFALLSSHETRGPPLLL
jgi:hypothetical protein